jgi:hypothetical protein
MGFHRYTGAAPAMAWRGMAQGHCRQCGQPSGSCCCGCRECRKEAKELVVTPDANSGNSGTLKLLDIGATQDPGAIGRLGNTGTSFIGGGCCVALAVEYAASVATTGFGVAVLVRDSEGTELIWRKTETAGTTYRVHECIITTKPGATLVVEVSNCTARVRWCEVFSC